MYINQFLNWILDFDLISNFEFNPFTQSKSVMYLSYNNNDILAIWTRSKSGFYNLVGNYMFKVNKRNMMLSMFKVNNKETNGVIEIVLVSSLLTLNILNTLFYCLYC